jgi:hypothetical protein
VRHVRGGDPEVDGELDELIHRADLDGLVRLIDARTATGDWAGLARTRERARFAVGTGRQLWPAATLAEYRLALLAPPEWAVTVLDEGSGRFTIGPLTEVVAQHHTWRELAPMLDQGPRAGLVAHERSLRGEDVGVPDGPNPLDLPYALAPWEPAYCLATYGDAGVELPSPAVPTGWIELAPPPADHVVQVDDQVVELAVRQLVEPWTASSDGRAEVVAVEGDAAAAVGALGITTARAAALAPAAAISWLAWAGASGGAHGRRRGAATGRFGAMWVLSALADVLDEWPVPLAELGELAGELRWWWWDAHEPVTGWQLQLAVEDPADGLAWAIAARDA